MRKTVPLRKDYFLFFSKLFSEFFQTSANCRVLSKTFWIGRQNCTLPVQNNVSGKKRFAGGFKFLKFLGVELKHTEQLCACFSVGLSKMPYTFPEDQFGRGVDSKKFPFWTKKETEETFSITDWEWFGIFDRLQQTLFSESFCEEKGLKSFTESQTTKNEMFVWKNWTVSRCILRAKEFLRENVEGLSGLKMNN